MESDSTLTALILGIAALALAAFEAGAGAAARVVRDETDADGDDALALVSDLPGGPAASLRCVSAIAAAVAIAAASAWAVAAWGLGWELVAPVGALSLAAVAGVSFAARALGARFARRIYRAACRADWLLSFIFKPALRVHARLSADADRREESGLAVEFHDEPFDEYELEMIRGVVRLDKTLAEDIMTRRVDMAVASASAALGELADVMVSAGHSRIPVCEEDNIDKIIGVAHARDLLPILANGENRGKTAKDVARPPLFIPEFKTLEELLKEFQETRIHMALVADEYGGVSGIVTIEDLLEEIVGEIRDEFDEGEREPPAAVPIGDSEYRVDADLPLDDFSRELGVETVGNGFKTIGGLVNHKLGKIPVAGDKVEYGGLTIEVESAAHRRSYTLKVKREVGGDDDE